MNPRRIIVIGAGVIGVSTAHMLRMDGHEVRLLEASGEAANGTSHANGGYLSAAFCAPWAMPGLPREAFKALFDRQAPFRFRPDGSLAQLRWMRELLSNCDAKQFSKHHLRMVRLALMSRVQLNHVVAQTGLAFDLRDAGVLQLFWQAPKSGWVEQRLSGLRGLGFDAQWLAPHQVRSLEPALVCSEHIAGGLYVRDDASGDCARFTQDLLAWNIQRGLLFEAQTRIDALELDRSGQQLVAVRSGGNRWTADAFIFATGVDTSKLLHAHLRVPVIPVKGYTVTAPVVSTQSPQCAVIDDATKLAIARLGDQVRLAGMAEVVGHDRRINAVRCDQLVRHYEALYGSLPLHGRVQWTGLRPMTPDGMPIIGATSIQGLYLNTGHGTYGWTLACGSARLLADVIAQRPSELDPQNYALNAQLRNRN